MADFQSVKTSSDIFSAHSNSPIYLYRLQYQLHIFYKQPRLCMDKTIDLKARFCICFLEIKHFYCVS